MTIDTRAGSNVLKMKRYECGAKGYDNLLKDFSKCKTLESAFDFAKDLTIDEDSISIWFVDGNMLLKFIIEDDGSQSSYANIEFYCDGVSFMLGE